MLSCTYFVFFVIQSVSRIASCMRRKKIILFHSWYAIKRLDFGEPRPRIAWTGLCNGLQWETSITHPAGCKLPVYLTRGVNSTKINFSTDACRLKLYHCVYYTLIRSYNWGLWSRFMEHHCRVTRWIFFEPKYLGNPRHENVQRCVLRCSRMSARLWRHGTRKTNWACSCWRASHGDGNVETN